MMRPGRAATPESLKQLRRQLGDDTVAPFTCYVAADTGGERPPVALASGHDPATWRSWAWRNEGLQCRVAVPDRKGGLIVSEGTGRVFVARTAIDVLNGWLVEHDVTVSGPCRGLRRVSPVQSHPALVELVGRREHEGDVTADEPLVFSRGDRAALLAEASTVPTGAELARRTGVPSRTAQRVVAGISVPSELTIRRLARTTTVEDRYCQGCGLLLAGRPNRRWCGESCRARSARGRRAGVTSTPETRELAVRLGERFGFDTVPMSRHPAYLRAAAGALCHMDVASIVERVVDGYGASLNGVADPARVITSRLSWVTDDVSIRAQMAAEKVAEADARRANAEESHRRRLQALVATGDIDRETAQSEMRRFGADFESVPT